AAGRLAGKERILNQKNGRPSGRPKVAQRALPYDESLLGLAEQSPLKYTIGNLSPFFELRQGGIVSTPQRTPYILGIDLGSSSIGWALVHLSPLGKPDALLKTGVRIFEPGVSGTDLDIQRGKDESKAVERRSARLQ